MSVQTASQPAWRTNYDSSAKEPAAQPIYQSPVAPLAAQPLASTNEIYHSPSRGVQDFSEQELSGRDYSNRNFAHAIFYKAKLCHVNFSGADLSYADLRGANLQGAKLRGVKLSGADLRGANLTGVDLQHVNLAGARYDKSTQFSSPPHSPLGRATRLADRRTPALKRASTHFANPQPFLLPMGALGTPTRSHLSAASSGQSLKLPRERLMIQTASRLQQLRRWGRLQRRPCQNPKETLSLFRN